MEVLNKAKYMILILAIICIVIGVMQQEHMVVWRKAVNICLECIGIG